MPEILEAPFRLYQDDPVIAVADGVASTWSGIWKYQVPVGVSLIIKPSHTFAAYIEDGSAEVGDHTCSVRIEKRDASESDVAILFGPKLYKSVKQFVDTNRIAKFSVPEEGVSINEREYLVVVAYDDGTIDESDSYFEMHIAKVRKALGA